MLIRAALLASALAFAAPAFAQPKPSTTRGWVNSSCPTMPCISQNTRQAPTWIFAGNLRSCGGAGEMGSRNAGAEVARHALNGWRMPDLGSSGAGKFHPSGALTVPAAEAPVSSAQPRQR